MKITSTRFTTQTRILNPLRRQSIATLFSTQPPIAAPVQRLRAFDPDETIRVAA